MTRRSTGLDYSSRGRYRVINIAINALHGTLSTKGLPYEMNEYNLKALLVVLSQAGIAEVLVGSDVRAGAVDAVLFFTRPDS